MFSFPYQMVIRSSYTNEPITALGANDIQHAYTIADDLMQIPTFKGCYIICVDGFGNAIFHQSSIWRDSEAGDADEDEIQWDIAPIMPIPKAPGARPHLRLVKK